MGQMQSRSYNYNFEDVQHIITNNKNNITHKTLLINVLKEYEQACLIKNTIDAKNEVNIINECLKTHKHIHIIIYGKHNCDENVEKKQKQLSSLGFVNVFAYKGGIFEWLLLQDIFGNDLFPTTTNELDILKFKPPSHFYNNLLTNSID
jgi:hypothetical protein